MTQALSGKPTTTRILAALAAGLMPLKVAAAPSSTFEILQLAAVCMASAFLAYANTGEIKFRTTKLEG